MNLDEHYLLINGETYGPFSFEQLHELWQREELPLDTFYVRKGMREVRPLEEILNQIIAYRRPEPEALQRPSLPDRINPKLVVLISLVIAGLYALLSGLKALYYQPEHVAQVVQAEIQASPVELIIVNHDSLDWTNKVALLNNNLPGSYLFHIAHLGAGKSLKVSLIGFKDGEGRPFEPWKEPVLQVWIGGNGHDYRRFIPLRESGRPAAEVP